MSDFILKIFPIEDVAVDKTELIKQALIKSKFLNGNTRDLHGKTYLNAGEFFCDFFEFEDEGSARNAYQKEVGMKISADGYGVTMEEDAEEPTFIDRKNVLEVWNADGNYTNWDKLVQLLEQTTGDAYTGEWEIL